MGSTVSLGLAYCCCTQTGNLCNSCLGSTAEGTSGRKRAVLLLVMAILVAFWFQYSVGPSIVTESGWIWRTYRAIPGTGRLVYSAWSDSSCSSYEGKLLSQCAGNAGVYRPMFLTTVFFLISAIAVHANPSLNREAWPAKYTVFFFALLFTMFIPNNPLFTGFYLWVARLAAAAFVVLQQIILIDVSYNLNDDWVERSNELDRISYGEGVGWIRLILGTTIVLYGSALTGIGLLYHFFDGCPENTWVITLTLLGIVALTAIQLSGDEGSVLTSSIMSVYAVYLAFSIVSKNPNGTCNPRLGHQDVWGIVVGLTLTTISLAWTGFSWTAERRLNLDGVQNTRAIPSENAASDSDGVNLDVPFMAAEEQPTGIVMSSGSTRSGSDLWKINVVMALISCWVAMTLTGWGTVDNVDDNLRAANPTAGRVNMAILGVSQWLAIGLYIWTLLAPRIFPDRDFS
mmetsp:Transcript_14017/g.23780  ORF Transcript_14017/g.23780 Transcript_14017/m.23780 type:complete len:457 (-) Transcript_14017:285-1655(-)